MVTYISTLSVAQKFAVSEIADRIGPSRKVVAYFDCKAAKKDVETSVMIPLEIVYF